MDISMAKLKVSQLQALLRANGLPVHYRRKTELVTRIKSHARKNTLVMGTDSKLGDDGGAGACGSGSSKMGASGAEGAAGASGAGAGSSSADGARGARGAQGDGVEARSVFAFKDVEESLTKFNGDADVETWLDGFNEVAETCAWSAVQRYVYGRRLLRGAAKLAVESTVGVNSWALLMELLRTEFSVQLSGRDVHNRLRNRTKLPTESLIEYAYEMRKLSNLGDIDEKSLLDYIVAGVPDTAVNKTIMYAANSFVALKRSFTVYEAMKEAEKTTPAPKTTGADAAAVSPRAQRRRCGLCGGFGHEAAVCPNMDKGPKCFKCTAFGHISTNCPTNNAGARNSSVQVAEDVEGADGAVVAVACKLPDMHVHADVYDQKLVALVDTGSDVTIIKTSIYERLPGPPAFDGPPITLRTLGSVVQRSSGSFRALVVIDGQDFVVSCQVLPDALMVGDMMLGRDLLRCASMSVIDGRVEIVKRSGVECDSVNALARMNVQTLVADEAENTTVRDYTDIELKTVFRPAKPRVATNVVNAIDVFSKYASPIFVARKEVISGDVTEVLGAQVRDVTDRRAASSTTAWGGEGRIEKMVIAHPMQWYRHGAMMLSCTNATIWRGPVRTPLGWLEDVRSFEDDRFEVVAGTKLDIERTQFSVVAIMRPNYLGPYVVKVMRNYYVLQRVRDGPGPISMTSAADVTSTPSRPGRTSDVRTGRVWDWFRR